MSKLKRVLLLVSFTAALGLASFAVEEDVNAQSGAGAPGTSGASGSGGSGTSGSSATAGGSSTGTSGSSGSSDAPETSGGGGCSIAQPYAGSSLAVLNLLAVLALVARRRR